MMKAILLAAGLGTRLLPLTKVLPKCLMPIHGTPLLAYWLNGLSHAGISSVLVNVHHHKDYVSQWIESSPWKDIIKISVEEELLGTAGTVLKNRSYISDQPVMLIHGDNLCSADIREFMAAHASRPEHAALTMMTFRTPYPRQCGIIQKDAHGVVREFHEKVEDPPGNLANAAVYILEPEVVDFISTLKPAGSPFIDFSTQVLPCYTGRIYTWHNGDYHRDIGSLESLLYAQTDYPDPGPCSMGNPFWARECDGAISLQMLETLARCLAARVVRGHGRTKEDIVRSLSHRKGERIILFFHDLPSNVDQILDHILHSVPKGHFHCPPFLFFYRVPQGFSSKKLFETYHMKSLAMRVDQA